LESLEDLISTTTVTNGEFRFDIKFRGNDGGDIFSIFVDTKNYSNVSGIFSNLDQIKAYFRQITSFDQFRIIQQSRSGITLDGMKKAFKTAILKDVEGFYNQNQNLFNSLKLKNGLNVSNKSMFESFINENDLSQAIYSILKITN
jgi:hypothetical protein